MPVATLLTDFGTRDYYVAAVRGVLLRLAPGAQPIDLTHEIEPGNVAGGAFVLGAAAPTFPPGTVHLAVVDPGVGSDRRILAVAAGDSWFVGPDNGLLEPALEAGAARAVTRDELFLDAPGATFHGRDRFAPVAAYLLRGEPFDALGPPVSDPVRLDRPPPRRSADRLEGHLVHVDRFGNLITDLPTGWLGASRPTVRLGAITARRRVRHYAELAAGEAGVVPGSLGTLELSLAGQSLADRCGLAAGAPIVVELADDAVPSGR